jgi:hypothetical protein
MAARRSEQLLYLVYLERVIKIEAVQCHQAAVTDDYNTQFLFFEAGCRPKLRGHFQWSLDSPEEDLPGAPPEAPYELILNQISPPMQLAWDAAVAAFKEFIEAIKKGELIANGMHAATGVRQDLDPAEWTREGLILDVRNGDLFEGGYVRHVRRSEGDLIHWRSNGRMRWSTITLQAVIQEQKLGRIDWDALWNEDVARREKGQLPNEKAYVRELETRIKERYGVSVDGGDLRRFKAALYRGKPVRPRKR